ncbi:hypothetical protein JOF53_003036 [Crossiella equi]|uniref:Transcriptional regulator, AbiEi antitoxin, Type IV TA system n=1 Tax=Crossiella equi TaxID=130796 RepID=A0ABS5AC64_9PSEU|nr:type IV toxin-antitoxin system AbiEi family antitoxin domain-containing protein [Crossiella equi]MBP2474164.1 hypothetical protein [Crossiella equi]
MPSPTWLDRTCSPDGLLSRERALALGVRDGALAHAVRTGVLHRLQRGCYLRADTPPSPEARARAALRAAGRATAVASHHTAARLHGLALPPDPGPEHVTVPRAYRHIRRRELVSHSGALPEDHVTRVRGVPVTTVPRTVLDLARLLPRLPAVWLVEHALHHELTTHRALSTCLDTLPTAPGDRELRARLDAATGGASSYLACAARLALADAHLPLFADNHHLVTAGLSLGQVAGAYPSHQLALVFLEPNTPRGRRWLPLGWRVLTFSWRDILHTPSKFTTTIAEALDRSHPGRSNRTDR